MRFCVTLNVVPAVSEDWIYRQTSQLSSHNINEKLSYWAIILDKFLLGRNQYHQILGPGMVKVPKRSQRAIGSTLPPLTSTSRPNNPHMGKMNRGGFEPPHLTIRECTWRYNRQEVIKSLESRALDRSAIYPCMR